MEVFQHFNIRIDDGDIFSRCQVHRIEMHYAIQVVTCVTFAQLCNSNAFHQIDRLNLLGLRPGSIAEIEELEEEICATSSTARSWVLVNPPQDVERSGCTSTGAKIQFDSVPEGVILKQKVFYVCVDCGKCYWGNTLTSLSV